MHLASPGSSNNTRAMKQQSGFTLIELMITIAVVAILVTVGIPSFQTLLQSSRMATQSNELIAGLNTARSEAVRRNANIQVRPLDDGWEDGFEIVDPDDENEPLRLFKGFGNGITVDGHGGTVTFQGDGSLDPANSLGFNLEPDADCLGDMRRVITLSLSGSARTEVMACQ